MCTQQTKRMLALLAVSMFVGTPSMERTFTYTCAGDAACTLSQPMIDTAGTDVVAHMLHLQVDLCQVRVALDAP